MPGRRARLLVARCLPRRRCRSPLSCLPRCSHTPRPPAPTPPGGPWRAATAHLLGEPLLGGAAMSRALACTIALRRGVASAAVGPVRDCACRERRVCVAIMGAALTLEHRSHQYCCVVTMFDRGFARGRPVCGLAAARERLAAKRERLAAGGDCWRLCQPPTTATWSSTRTQPRCAFPAWHRRGGRRGGAATPHRLVCAVQAARAARVLPAARLWRQCHAGRIGSHTRVPTWKRPTKPACM